MSRPSVWRAKLMGHDIDKKRRLYYTFIQGQNMAEEMSTILADMPRTWSRQPCIQQNILIVQSLLVEYASIQRGDSYIQGFNYMMALLYEVFKDEEHAKADTWWCFSGIVSRIRALLPDFNVTWFHWCRRQWLTDFHAKLAKKRPLLNKMLMDESDSFSSLITCKWFMIWFVQNVEFEEIFELWDFLIEIPPNLLLKAYTVILFEILSASATSLTYHWSQSLSHLLHGVLSMKIKGVAEMLQRVRRHF